jgi:DNA-binding NarL/FixJ family response regulator
MPPTKILIIDNQKMVADALANLLPDYFVNVVTNSADALQALTERQFDYAFLEIALGDESGIILIKPLLMARVKPIMISGTASIGQLRACIRLGAYGFVDKCRDSNHFLDILKRVKSGSIAFPVEMIDELRQNPLLTIPKLSRVDKRLLDYFIFHADQTNDEIGKKLCLSEGRIRNNMTTLMRRFGVKGRLNLVKEAHLRGYFPGIDTAMPSH